MSNTGGSGKGTIRFKEELAHGANAGLDKAIEKLEPFKAKYSDVSYADLYTLAGVAAIEALGGPVIKWFSPSLLPLYPWLRRRVRLFVRQFLHPVRPRLWLYRPTARAARCTVCPPLL